MTTFAATYSSNDCAHGDWITIPIPRKRAAYGVIVRTVQCSAPATAFGWYTIRAYELVVRP